MLASNHDTNKRSPGETLLTCLKTFLFKPVHSKYEVQKRLKTNLNHKTNKLIMDYAKSISLITEKCTEKFRN